jgi:hypothetical protein
VHKASCRSARPSSRLQEMRASCSELAGRAWNVASVIRFPVPGALSLPIHVLRVALYHLRFFDHFFVSPLTATLSVSTYCTHRTSIMSVELDPVELGFKRAYQSSLVHHPAISLTRSLDRPLHPRSCSGPAPVQQELRPCGFQGTALLKRCSQTRANSAPFRSRPLPPNSQPSHPAILTPELTLLQILCQTKLRPY